MTTTKTTLILVAATLEIEGATELRAEFQAKALSRFVVAESALAREGATASVLAQYEAAAFSARSSGLTWLANESTARAAYVKELV